MGQTPSTPRMQRIIIAGLDGAGKTTLLYKLKTGEVVTTIPTIGFNVEKINLGGQTFHLWELGGSDKLKPLWKPYLEDVYGIIFVVDVHDVHRLDDAKNDFETWVLNQPNTRHVPVAIAANKQDLPGGMTNMEIAERLRLREWRQPWHIVKTSAVTGEGIWQCLEWIQQQLKQTPAIGQKSADKDGLEK